METDTLTAVREVLQWVAERHRMRKAHDAELGEPSKNWLKDFHKAAQGLRGVKPVAVSGALDKVAEIDKRHFLERLDKDKQQWKEFVAGKAASCKGKGAFNAAADLVKQAGSSSDAGEVQRLLAAARKQLLADLPPTLKPGDVPGATAAPAPRSLDKDLAVAALEREDLFKLIARNDTWGNFDADRALGPEATEADLKVLLNILESAVEADKQDAAWSKYEKEVGEVLKTRNDTKRAPKVYKEVILGAGASAAYYIASNFGKFDMNSVMILGQTQPWAGERGAKGNINHPHNQVDPQQKGKKPIEDKEEGLADRAEFSRRVAVMIDKLPHTKCNITKVRRCPQDFFEIETSAGNFYANKVTNAMGIGRQLKPTGIDPLAETKTHDMDTFKRALDGKTIKQAYPEVNSVCVSGGNAAIDVITAMVRDQGRNPSNKLQIHWVVGDTGAPAFLNGTDNALASKAFPGGDLADGGPIEKDNMKVYRGRLTGASGAGPIQVTCSYSMPARSKTMKTHSFQVDMVVYGTGPDVDAMQNMFVNETSGGEDETMALEPAIDKSRHYNVQIEEKNPGRLVEKMQGKLKDEQSARELQGFLEDPSLEAVVDVDQDVIVSVKSQDKEGAKSSMQFVGASGARLKTTATTSTAMSPRDPTQKHEAIPTLPENVVGNDQLTAARSRIEAQFNALPVDTENVPLVAVEGGINFITSNQTVIRVHIAECYPKIPPGLGDYVTGQIILERSRDTPKGEKPKTPIPMPREGDTYMENLSLDQQRAFQNKWTQRLQDISARIA